ncbi:hypothetical protein AX16_010463 [Volvariella volvacea WC 439]|nr:hypothetical protein AX16_010463 [Volvariella volvacea WC 439]
MIVNDFAEIETIEFDFIVIGGGTAGSVLANRLSENPDFRVLVIEAGPSHEDVLEVKVPWLAPKLWSSQYEWGYNSVPQDALGGRVLRIPRGRLLGGTSSFNFMMHTRGPREEYDDFARIAKDERWSWNSLQPYFRRNERWVPPNDGHDTTGQYDPSLHSEEGMVATSLAGYPTPIDQLIVAASRELGGAYNFTLDYCSGNPLGMGWLQTTIDGHTRSSAATAYLALPYLERSNLFVLVNAQVGRLLSTRGSSQDLDFRTVQFRSVGEDALREVTAKKEVILSAGVIGSPQILLNSGIGDQSSLSAVGVDPLVHLPDVGRNLVDHCVVANAWSVNSTDTFETTKQPHVSSKLLEEWKTKRTGPFVNTLMSHIGFFRLPEELTPQPDPASCGPTIPHYELAIANGIIIPNPLIPPDGHYLTIASAIMKPISRGSVTLSSSDPFCPPLINPAILSDPNKIDISIMREAIRSAQRFASASVWKDYIVAPVGGLEDVMTDEEMEDYILKRAGTFFHPTSTNRMSAWEETEVGVVNPDLTVKKVKNVRVVDASVFVSSLSFRMPSFDQLSLLPFEISHPIYHIA